MFGAAILTFVGKSRYVGAGMIFAAGLVTMAIFIQIGYFDPGLGRGFTAATTVITLAALAAAGSSAVFFAPEARTWRANMSHPLVLGFCAAAIAYAVAYIPGDFKFFNGSHWVTGVGLLGSGVHGHYIFVGIVALAGVAIPAVITGFLAPDTGVRAGVVTGWLLTTFSAQLNYAFVAGFAQYRLAPAFFVEWVSWGIALLLGIALIVADRRSQVRSAPTPSALLA